ncbi:SDR family oxidoreductase [Methyloraptor flagellatus]|uniref:SDR family oxidoreductase n=1 Tax=Methyloraptor flagellatus TaxID=3162530 RepID=A0AAU7X949_9HYPH
MTAAVPRSILITGASSGIGHAAAIGLRARGYRVFATARRDEDLRALEAAGVEALFLDYRDGASIAAAAETVLARTDGRLYGLFNNGAYGQPGAVEDLTTDVLRMQFEANLFGWHDLTRRVIPAMRAAGEGRIVQCSSVLGIIAMKYRGAYNASKHALEGLTDTLRLELDGTGIKVVSIRPGPIATRFVPNAMAMFHANIDIDASAHRDIYRRRLERMARGGASRFKLGPEAVVAKLVVALEHPNPAPAYAVTLPTHVMGLARRFLPERWRSALLGRLSDAEA